MPYYRKIKLVDRDLLRKFVVHILSNGTIDIISDKSKYCNHPGYYDGVRSMFGSLMSTSLRKYAPIRDLTLLTDLVSKAGDAEAAKMLRKMIKIQEDNESE